MSTTPQVLRAPSRPTYEMVAAPAIPTAPAVPTARAAGARRRLAIGLMAAGLAFSVGAVGLVAVTVGGDGSATATEPAPTLPAAGFMIEGTDSVVVHRMGYEPHGSSSWHRHNGIHAIAVLSGTLTIYGPDCQARNVPAGESYVGGQGVHLARNEAEEPVEMSVTYLFPAGVPLQDFVVPTPAPANCTIR